MWADAENAQAEAKRQEIVQHATDLFKHYGFWKTNISDISDRCGMSPGNLYRYYRNKQAIGLAVVKCYFESVEAALDTVTMIPEGSAEARIRKWLETGVQHLAVELEQHPTIVELAEFLQGHDEGIAILQAHIDWKRGRLAREIQRGIDDGSLENCNAEATAGAILNALKAFWMPMTLAKWRDKSTILPDLHGIVDLIFVGLRAR